MKRFNYRHIFTTVLLAAVTLGMANVLSGCGTMRSYWGVENEYEWGDGGHHKHHKPPKHKKHKHYKHNNHDDDD